MAPAGLPGEDGVKDSTQGSRESCLLWSEASVPLTRHICFSFVFFMLDLKQLFPVNFCCALHRHRTTVIFRHQISHPTQGKGAGALSHQVDTLRVKQVLHRSAGVIKSQQFQQGHRRLI